MVATTPILTAANFRLGSGVAKTPPLATDIGTTWSWVNQGTATVAQDSSGALVFSDSRQSFDNYRILARAIPATPYTVTAELQLYAPLGNYGGIGIGLRDSGTGKIIFVNKEYDSGASSGAYFVSSQYFSSPTAFGASAQWCATTVFNPQPVYLRFTDNGTNIFVYISWDGINWINMKPAGTSRTAQLATPNQIMLFMNPYFTNDPGFTITGICKDFWIS